MSAPQGMPAAYLPLCKGDHVELDGRDAIIDDPQPSLGQVTVTLEVDPSELVWIARYRQEAAPAIVGTMREHLEHSEQAPPVRGEGITGMHWDNLGSGEAGR